MNRVARSVAMLNAEFFTPEERALIEDAVPGAKRGDIETGRIVIVHPVKLGRLPRATHLDVGIHVEGETGLRYLEIERPRSLTPRQRKFLDDLAAYCVDLYLSGGPPTAFAIESEEDRDD